MSVHKACINRLPGYPELSRKCVAYTLYCKSGGSRSSKILRMEMIEKIISENHRDEFSATSGIPSIRPSPTRLTSGHLPVVIPATDKESNPTTL
ncbi:piggyBac transposable element-derived protein 4 [Trichonephila clavipes]|nr:piggyBac transposable element-derived protein 4 [Trichonephila clavipes]